MTKRKIKILWRSGFKILLGYIQGQGWSKFWDKREEIRNLATTVEVRRWTCHHIVPNRNVFFLLIRVKGLNWTDDTHTTVHHVIFTQVKAVPVELLVAVVAVVAVVVATVALAAFEMFLSCSRMLLRSLLTFPPNSSAINRRLYRCWMFGCTVEPGDIETNKQTDKQTRFNSEHNSHCAFDDPGTLLLH